MDRTWRDVATDVLLWLVRKLNPSRDRALSWRLHDMADEYDTRPSVSERKSVESS